MRLRRLQQTGDTIVEVLIATAVVSLILGSAFVVVNRSTNNAQQAQEHEEALNLLQTQVEKLKVIGYDPVNAAIFTKNNPFCIDEAGKVVDIGGSALPASSYPTECNVGFNGRYQVGIVQLRTGGAHNNTFSAHAYWDGPTGGKEQVNILYKLYP